MFPKHSLFSFSDDEDTGNPMVSKFKDDLDFEDYEVGTPGTG